MSSRKFQDETGNRYGRLVVIQRVADLRPGALWSCRCLCGGAATVRGQNLRSGKSKSCGCLNAELRIARAQAKTLSDSERRHSKITARRKWQRSNPERRRRNAGDGAANLADWYVRQVLARTCDCSAADVAAELIAAKREHLRLVRLLKEKQA